MKISKILIAPNAFKGSLSAAKVAHTIGEGLRLAMGNVDLVEVPIGDGGDGTGSLITDFLNGKIIETKVHDPIGRVINSSYGLIDSGQTAVIEMARASGINLLQTDELAPLKANTFGTGELISHALKNGVKKIILTIGGSATIDGGTGILRALGVKFLDKKGKEILDLPQRLLDIHSIDFANLSPKIKECTITILCDVTNPLIGDRGAARVFGPQKGADDSAVMLLERRLNHFAEIIRQTTQKDVADLKHGGAAGGVAAGMAGLLDATLVPGLDYYLSLVSFEDRVKECTIVITGEGAIDEQTLEGKGPFGVAKIAKEYGKKVVGMAGAISLDAQSELWNYFDYFVPINFRLVSVEDAIADTEKNLRLAAFNLGKVLKAME